jgi:hypothetical protein
MLNAICIGVHVRFATAHGAEKPGTVRLHDYFSEIDVLIKKLERMQRQYVIYLATDSNYVVEAFRKRYSRFLLYRDTIRSAYAEEVHLISERSDYWLAHVQEFHDKKPGYKGGKDVLLDCLILSRCDYLVHTTSNVSDFATFFNPTIQSIFIPKQIDPNKKRDCAACRVPDKWYDHEIF